jgi:hypothetical protein
MMPKSRYL